MKSVVQEQKGFFLIEVVVAVSVIAVVLILLLGSIQNTVAVSKRSLEQVQSAYLLEEGAEAIKVIRDNQWSNISGLTSGVQYYLFYNGTTWVTTTTPNIIDQFTRTVTVVPVYRDATDDIASSGTLDAGTRRVTVTVSWTAPRGVQNKTMALYVANIRE